MFSIYRVVLNEMPATTFIGNVLPATGQNTEGDSTFDFTSSESKHLDLTGVPLRIEHADSLPIGTVTKSWTKPNGEKWIMGQIDNEKGLASLYANHAIKPDSRGHTLYKGLSLQHVHQQWPDGSSVKRPIEVSICTEPRRPDCYIRAISETKKNEYIAHKASDKSHMSEQLQNTESTPVEQNTQNVSEAVGQASGEIQGKPGDAAVPVAPEELNARATANNQEELMKMFLAQDQKNQEMEVQMKKLLEEKTSMEHKWKEREENEAMQTKSKAEALSHALVKSWQNTLPAGEMTEENKKAIFALAQNFPQESVQMMEIAHKASVKHRTDRSLLVESEANANKRVLEQQVVDTIMKRRKTGGAPVTTVQAASIKAAPAKFNPFTMNRTPQRDPNQESFGKNNAMLFGALKGMSSGSARSMMDNIAKYRNKM
jgi:hypothetical protein